MPPRIAPGNKIGKVEGDHQKTKDYDLKETATQKKKFTYFYTKIELEEMNAKEKASKQVKQIDNKAEILKTPSGGMSHYNSNAQAFFPTPDPKASSLLTAVRDKKDEQTRTLVKPKIDGMFDAHLV